MRIDPASMSPDQLSAAMASLDESTEGLIDTIHRQIDALPNASLRPAAQAFLDAYGRGYAEHTIDDAAIGDGLALSIVVTLGDIRRLRRALAE